MKVRNQRTGKWIELPDPDGLIWYAGAYRLYDEVTILAQRFFRGERRSTSVERYWECYGPPSHHDATTPTLEEWLKIAKR